MRGRVRSIVGVLRKDLRSELRTRYAVNALLMFVVTTVTIVVFSFGSEGAPNDVLAGVLWVIIFFGAMSGLSRSFVVEEERGTAMTLQLLTAPLNVFFGKLLFNVVLVTALNAVTVLLFAGFVGGFHVKAAGIFVVVLSLGSMGFAAASTIIAAIIARANSKGTLFPVLAFPILLPLLLVVIDATRLAADGAFFEEALGDFQLLLSYIVVMLTVSYVSFEHIWKD